MASVISSWLPSKRPTSDPSRTNILEGGGRCLPKLGPPGNWFVRSSVRTAVPRFTPGGITENSENYTFYLGHLVAATAVHGSARHEIGFFDLGLGSVKARSRRGGSPRLSSRGIGEWPLARPITNDIKHTAAEALRSNFSPKSVIIEKIRQTMFESTV